MSTEITTEGLVQQWLKNMQAKQHLESLSLFCIFTVAGQEQAQKSARFLALVVRHYSFL